MLITLSTISATNTITPRTQNIYAPTLVHLYYSASTIDANFFSANITNNPGIRKDKKLQAKAAAN
jgi:hypothetical protein